MLFNIGSSPIPLSELENDDVMLLEKRSLAIKAFDIHTKIRTPITIKNLVLNTVEGESPLPCNLNACKRGLINGLTNASGEGLSP